MKCRGGSLNIIIAGVSIETLLKTGGKKLNLVLNFQIDIIQND